MLCGTLQVYNFIFQSPWEDVEHEMVNEKGLSKEVAEKIGVHIMNKGTLSCLVDHLNCINSRDLLVFYDYFIQIC